MTNRLSLKKPSRTKEEAKAEKIAQSAQKLSTDKKRLVAEVPARIHKQVRLRCVEREIDIRDYLLELLKKDGIG